MTANQQNITTARILDVAINSLRTVILPQLPADNDALRIHFDQITRLLKTASSRLSNREEGLQALLAEAKSIGLNPASNSTEASLEELEKQRQAIEQQISDRLPALVAESAKGQDAVNELEKIIAMEKTFFISQDPDVAHGSQICYRGGRIDNEQFEEPKKAFQPLNNETMTAYLQQRESRSTVSASDVRVIPGGFSKDTIFFTRHDEQDGSSQNLVIRKDMEVPFIEKTVVNEFPLLSNLHKRDFAVAKPLWLEENRELFGGCFIVSERVEGTSNAASWASDPERAQQACRELAKVLATLHAYDPIELGYPEELAKQSAGELFAKDIADWTRLFHAKKSEPIPLQELPLIWLAENIPAALYDRPARVVHGDVGFHNLMFNDKGEVTALLDWEFSLLGEPTQDLCFVRQFVEPLMDWQAFMDLYLSLGGVGICEEATFFFDLWTKARNTIGCVESRTLFDTVMPEQMKFALTGYVFAPYLYVDECESLLNHLKAK